MADEIMVKYTVDQAVLDANPELVEKGVQVGDELERPETPEETAERVDAEAKATEADAEKAEETAKTEESDAEAAEETAHEDADTAAAANVADQRHPTA